MAIKSHNHQHQGAIWPFADRQVASELDVRAAALAI